jgi:hypothetical protein
VNGVRAVFGVYLAVILLGIIYAVLLGVAGR